MNYDPVTNEAEWLSCRHPVPMQYIAERGASERKLRLFAVACCRSAFQLLTDQRSRAAVEIAEAFADGHATITKLGAARNAAWAAVEASRPPLEMTATQYDCALSAAYQATWNPLRKNQIIPWHPAWQSGGSAAFAISLNAVSGCRTSMNKEVGWAVECDHLRDMFGSLFRAAPIAASWVTPEVIVISEGIYAERAFDRMPELANALERAGCTDADILTHCRAQGIHSRGCWVVDILLNKK